MNFIGAINKTEESFQSEMELVSLVKKWKYLAIDKKMLGLVDSSGILAGDMEVINLVHNRKYVSTRLV